MTFDSLKQVVVVVVFAVLAACGHDDGDIDEVIGAACTDDRECETRCYRDGDLPGGFCSQPCASDQDCPIDTYCMSTNGGMCLFGCPEFDCDRLGAGWECRERSRVGGGDTFVCSGN